MNFSIWLDTMSLRMFIVHTKGSLKIVFILANSVDPDAMTHSAAF